MNNQSAPTKVNRATCWRGRCITLLETRRVLLVLDGLERLLLAYRRLDAAQIADEAVSLDRTPRACSDPRDGAFLRRLTLCERSKILISSRLIPQELQDRHNQQLIAGVRSVHLYGMTPEDALTMFEGLGVHGNREVMRTLLGQFGDHALLISVLAGRITAYRPAPGDFDAWYAEQGRDLHLEAQDLTQRRTSILTVALSDLDHELFAFLGLIAAFRYPVEYDVLLAINPYLPALEGDLDQEAKLSAVQQLNEALTELEARGLVQWERATNRYDLHPVVRAYAYDHLADQAGAFARIRGYFEALPAEDTTTVRDVSQLRRTLEIYYALLHSGQGDAAFDSIGIVSTIYCLRTGGVSDDGGVPAAVLSPRHRAGAGTEPTSFSKLCDQRSGAGFQLPRGPCGGAPALCSGDSARSGGEVCSESDDRAHQLRGCGLRAWVSWLVPSSAPSCADRGSC